MASEAQKLFDLIDSYWFAHRIFKKTQNPPPKIQKNEESVSETTENLDFSTIPTINIRSYSDQMFITPNQQSLISESALSNRTPKLETIFSGKESEEIKLPVKLKEKTFVSPERGRRKRRNNSKSKSLSELEFEELKGFMDLGFLFSEKDKDSSLVSIIPGLQRLGEDVKEIEEEKVEVLRPYLSEAWSDLKNKSEEEIRLIKIPAFGDETEIKHQLRFWAHSVASVVR